MSKLNNSLVMPVAPKVRSVTSSLSGLSIDDSNPDNEKEKKVRSIQRLNQQNFDDDDDDDDDEEEEDDDEEEEKKRIEQKKKEDEEREKERIKKELEREKERKSSQLFSNKKIIKANGVSYIHEKIIGSGSFGVVYQATVVGTGEMVAIKRVLQDRRFKNRELQIMRLISHPNIIQLKNSFFTYGEKMEEVYLNLVMEYIPETVYKVCKSYGKLNKTIPLTCTKVYMYQLGRALGYIHSLGICHRDIKPQNLLIDPNTGVLKLIDFGSAKILIPDEPNVSYICSRYYRAPELIFGAQFYTTAIDMWSMGCVMAELLLGQPLFPGESGVDQLVEIIKVLGTPTAEQVQAMNQNYTDQRFPPIKGHSWTKVFNGRVPDEAIDLISKLVTYTPTNRLKPMTCLLHPFFDELRQPGVTLPNNRDLPPLFNFSPPELNAAGHTIKDQLIPQHLSPKTTQNETTPSSTSSVSSTSAGALPNATTSTKSTAEESPN